MDKANLIKDRVTTNTRPVEIPAVGEVTVRGLSRLELLLVGKNTDDAALIERRTVAYGMVDPAMDEKDVEQWQKVSPAGEIAVVTAAIRDLSGLGEGAQKSRVQAVRD